MEFLPLPAWDHLHPLIIHFPVALLLVAPLFGVLGALWKENRRGLLMAGLVLMVLGTSSSYVAVATGEAAAELVHGSQQVTHVLLHHQKLAETVRFVFTALTTLYALLLFLPGRLKKPLGKITAIALTSLFLALYAAGTVLLANTAHNGGRLVHEFGVRAFVPVAPSPSASQAPEPGATQAPGPKQGS